MISAGQYSVSSSQVVFHVPPGPCNVSVGCSSGTAAAGPGTAVTASQGFQLPQGTVLQWQQYEGSQGCPVAFVSLSGTATVSFWVSTNS